MLDSILTLTELPRHPPQDSSLGGSSGGNRAAAHPSPEDAREFAAHVRLFAPGDYDALVEERNSLGRCGYALCPQPRRLFGGPKGRGGSSGGGGGGTWKLNWATGDIVPRKELEKWCSTKCARRALYIKVQLNETAVWERAGIPSITIDLLPEDDERTSRKQDHVDKVSAGLERLRLDAELALERGESGAAKATKVDMTVKEKEVGAPKEIGPSSDYDHRAIEGYAPKRTA